MTPPTYPGDATYGSSHGDRRARRAARRDAAQSAQTTQASGVVDGAAENSEQATPRRWRPTISNPFRNMRMPTIPVPGRARQGPTTADAEPSPSQLEAGNTVR